MGFRFNIEKAMQSVATLLHFHGTKEMSYLRLLKILYIADRESLQETGQPITGDQIREGAANSERMCLDHADILIEQKLIDC